MESPGNILSLWAMLKAKLAVPGHATTVPLLSPADTAGAQVSHASSKSTELVCPAIRLASCGSLRFPILRVLRLGTCPSDRGIAGKPGSLCRLLSL